MPLAGRSILCDEMQHTLSRVITIVATEDVGAMGAAGVEVDFFRRPGYIVHMSGIGDEGPIVLAVHKKLRGVDRFYLIIAHSETERLRA